MSAPQASISPKYLYDPLGSKLFEAICLLDEYYPTRTEANIFALHADDIAATIGQGVTLIDLGAGNCAKAASLFASLQPRQYVPIDISAEFLRESVAALAQKYPAERRLFFYPGSSLGNFAPEEALQFLRRIRQSLPLG